MGPSVCIGHLANKAGYDRPHRCRTLLVGLRLSEHGQSLRGSHKKKVHSNGLNFVNSSSGSAAQEDKDGQTAVPLSARRQSVHASWTRCRTHHSRQVSPAPAEWSRNCRRFSKTRLLLRCNMRCLRGRRPRHPTGLYRQGSGSHLTRRAPFANPLGA